MKKAKSYGVTVTDLKLPPITSFAVGKNSNILTNLLNYIMYCYSI